MHITYALEFGTAFPVPRSRVLLHSDFGESKSLIMVVSPGTEWQKGISTGHTSEDSVLPLREANVGFPQQPLLCFSGAGHLKSLLSVSSVG